MATSHFFFRLFATVTVALIGCNRETPAPKPAGNVGGRVAVENEPATPLESDNEEPDEVIIPTDEKDTGAEKNAVAAEKMAQLVKKLQVRQLSVGFNNPSSARILLPSAQLDDISEAQREFSEVAGEQSIGAAQPIEKLLTSPWVKDVTLTLGWDPLDWASNTVLTADKLASELKAPPDRKDAGKITVQQRGPFDDAGFTEDIAVTWTHWSWASAAFTERGELKALRFDGRGWRTTHPEPTRARLFKETRDAQRAHPNGVNALVFSDDGQLISFGSRSLHWWNIDTGEKRFTLPLGSKASSSRSKYLPNEELLVLASVSHGLVVDVREKKVRRSLPGFSWPFDLLPGTMQAVMDDDQHISLWDLKQGASLTEAKTPPDLHGIMGLKVRGDGKQAATGFTSGKVMLWSLPELSPGPSLARHTDRVNAIAYSADHKVLYSGGWDGLLNAWDSATGTHLFERRTPGLSYYDELLVSPDGKLLVASSRRDGDKVVVWPLPDAREATIIPSPQSLSGLIKLDPSGKLLLVAGKQGEIWLHNLPDGVLHATLHKHKVDVTSLAISSDGKVLVSGDSHGHVLVWSFPEGKVLRELGAPPSPP